MTCAKCASWPTRKASGIATWISRAAILDGDARELLLQRGDARLHGAQHLAAHRRRSPGRRRARQVAVGLRLPDLDRRARALVDGEVGVAGSRRRLPVPDHVQLRVDAAQRVGHERVAEVLERAVLHRRARGSPGNRGSPVTRRKSGFGDHRRPALRRQHADVLAVVERLVREERPLHEVDQVRADVVQPLALLGGVEEPRRPDVRRARRPPSSGGARSPCRPPARPRCPAAARRTPRDR